MKTHRKNKILIVAYPKQGIIIPSLRFADRLLKSGVDVTFVTSVSITRRLDKETIHPDLTIAPFSDGHDDGQQPSTTLEQYYADFTTNGISAVTEIIRTAAAAGQPFDHLVYTLIVPWAGNVAKGLSLESTLLWCQAATILDIYYYYFNGYERLISCNNNDPTFPINLPGLPSLTTADLPSFLLSSSPKEHDFIIQFLKDHFDVLSYAPRVLVNTFDELELESIKAVEKLVMFPVGPLVPLHNSFEKTEEDYVKWLNTKPKSSVVYVSFGSLATLSMDQADEMALGLIESGLPFLWVIRDDDQEMKLSKIEELKKQGMIVNWCSQVEVLNHKAIGCFLTHCGWNSTIEALAAGVPSVVLPQWSDQATNAKMIEDVWKTGVRLKKREEDGIVEGKEIKRCLEMVMGDDEIMRNAEKWKELATEAFNNGGSSDVNLQAFLNDA